MCKKLIGLVVVIILILSVGCSSDKKPGSSDIINIVATTGMIGDLALNIGGKRVEVITLMGPGIDPHLYKASERDVSRMSGADIIFYNGLHLEGAMAEVLERMGERSHTAAVAERVSEDRLLSPPEFKGVHDPHIWFDVTIWMSAAETVNHHLKKNRPAFSAEFDTNLEVYLDSLKILHQFVLDMVGKLPEDKRVLITAHDAFNYFGRIYGFEVRGLQGISTASEAGAADVRALAEFIVKRKIPAMFVETSVSPRNIEAVKAAVESRDYDVVIGGNLFSDAMGDKGTVEGTYLGMIRHNITTIVSALAGEMVEGHEESESSVDADTKGDREKLN